MEPSFLKLGGMALFAASVFGLAYVLLPGQREREAKKQLAEPTPGQDQQSGFLGVFKPFIRFLLPLTERFLTAGHTEKLRRQLITAGLDRILTPGEFLAFQLVMLALFAACAGLLWKDGVAAVIAGLLGLAYPIFWLMDKKKTRQREISLSMPDVVDMLSLSVQAGQDFLAAIRRICDLNREHKDPFVQEIGIMYQNIKLGMGTEEALTNLAERVDIQDMYSFTSILIQAQRMGASIAEVLAAQALRMRQQRFMRAERIGAQAAQKLLIPMMLCILPILFIIIFGPYLLKYIYGG